MDQHNVEATGVTLPLQHRPNQRRQHRKDQAHLGPAPLLDKVSRLLGDVGLIDRLVKLRQVDAHASRYHQSNALAEATKQIVKLEKLASLQIQNVAAGSRQE